MLLNKIQNINKINYFFFSLSLYRAYSHVNWDAKLPSKLHAPTSTYEKFVDPLKECDQIDHRTQIWQVKNLF